jgi:hypothetical protein
LPFEVYGTFANYSPRGNSELSQRSRRLRGAIKAGREPVIRSAFPFLKAAGVLEPFLNPAVTLVPVPRSAPLAEGALWPSKVIADLLIEGGFGGEVLPCIRRVSAVQRSASARPEDRPLWPTHYDSLVVEAQLIKPAQITLVDDVLTMGRTTYACAQRIREAFPHADVRIFAMMRTLGFLPDIDALVDPSIGTVTGYPSGKTHRTP